MSRSFPALILVAALIAGCAADSAATRPATSLVTPSPSQPTTATDTSSPPAAPSPSQLSSERYWSEFGMIAYRAPLEVLTSFSGGYVAAAGSGDSTAWFSQDGRKWEERQPAEMVERPCPQSPVDFVVADGYVAAGATNGHAVLLVGGARHFTAETCANQTIGLAGKVAWVTSDGRTWTRSESFGPPHAYVSSVWAIPGGWEAALSAWDEPTTIWQSADGLYWRETMVVGKVNSYGLGTASADGTRLLATRNERDQPVLLRSDDGQTWRELEAPFIDAGSYGYISHIVPPPAAGPASWLVVTSDQSTLPISTTTWTSSDLRRWDHQDFPGQLAIRNLVATRQGYIASLSPICDTLGGDEGGGGCVVPESEYLSADGLDWTPLKPALGFGALFVDGPTGVLAIGDGMVWRLEP